ncbi:hypothetical protein OOU_Y34scaffold00931g1, partial [Pyricularia oryzae Y34]
VGVQLKPKNLWLKFLLLFCIIFGAVQGGSMQIQCGSGVAQCNLMQFRVDSGLFSAVQGKLRAAQCNSVQFSAIQCSSG